MNNLKLAALFTVLLAWGVTLFITMSSTTSFPSEEISSKESNIILDSINVVEYTEYTDDIHLIKSYELAKYNDGLKEKRIASEKLAEEKRIAEKKRQAELAKLAEEKRIAELVAKRDAKNKLKAEQKKAQVASVSRGQSPNFSESYYEVTAYTAGYESTGKHKGDKNYGLTASGEYVKANRTIACPKSISFGTKIQIEGYGVFICEDRGAHIVNGRLDIYMVNLNDALDFGRRTLRVKIYN